MILSQIRFDEILNGQQYIMHYSSWIIYLTKQYKPDYLVVVGVSWLNGGFKNELYYEPS